MNEKLKDVRFITLKDSRKIGNVLLDKEIPLPVQFEENQKPEDLSLASITAGLVKIAAYDRENENFDYYKRILLEMQPNAVEELNTAAVAKSQKEDWDFALELMLAVNHLCELPESYVNLAVLYAQMTVFFHKKNDDVVADMYDDKIIETLNECIKKYPDFAPAYNEISAFHLRHGDIDNAADFLEKFVSLSKDSHAVKQAEKTLERLKKTQDSTNQIMYAYDKMMMGCSSEALEVCNKFLAANDPTWEVLFIRGWAKRTLEDFDGAQRDLLESLKIESGNAEVYNELSICVREAGNIELAKNYLEIASDLDPEDAVYITNLAFLHLSDGEFAESRKCIEKARAIDSQDPQLLYIIKQYEEKTGDKIGEIIKEEIYTDEEFEALHQKEHDEHTHYNEV